MVRIFSSLILAELVLTSSLQEDVGYEMLWEDSTAEVDWECWPQPSLPSWLSGSFILPSVAQFSMGGLHFQGVLDGYGKLHRFQVADGKVCMRARMMMTDFYNKSLQTGTVPPAMLFEETVPPRKKCYRPLCNALSSSNDNTYVNTIRIGEEFSTWTDSPMANAMDPYTLDLQGLYEWTDGVGKHFGHMGVLGSAHPLRQDRNRGDYVSIKIDAAVVEGLGLGAFVDIMTIGDDKPHERQLLTTSRRLHHAPYIHSFGVTKDYVAIPFTPMSFHLMPPMENKPMSTAFSQSTPLVTTFGVYPLAGGEPLEFTAPAPFTTNHVVNAFQNESGIVYDAVTFPDASAFVVSDVARLSIQRNKSARDESGPAMSVWRYVLHMNGTKAGSVTSEQLSRKGRAVDFPKINMARSSVKHCIYYAVEWFHNGREMGSMALLKHDVCKATQQYWYRPSSFPSEAVFVPRPDAADEDDGVLLFSVTDGKSGNSSFVVADGKSLDTVVEQYLPVRVTFTTHGEWFDGLVGRSAPGKFHMPNVNFEAVSV